MIGSYGRCRYFKKPPNPTSAEIFKGSIFVRKGQENDITLVLTSELDLGNWRCPTTSPVLWNVWSAWLPCFQKLPQGYSLEIKMGH